MQKCINERALAHAGNIRRTGVSSGVPLKVCRKALAFQSEQDLPHQHMQPVPTYWTSVATWEASVPNPSQGADISLLQIPQSHAQNLIYLQPSLAMRIQLLGIWNEARTCKISNLCCTELEVMILASEGGAAKMPGRPRPFGSDMHGRSSPQIIVCTKLDYLQVKYLPANLKIGAAALMLQRSA